MTVMPFLRFFQMNSALGQNNRYLRYISAIWEGPLRVTAELTEMVQYLGLLPNFCQLEKFK